MKPKIYSVGVVASAAEALAKAPPLPPTHIAHDQAMAELTAVIRQLHTERHYEPREIAQMLRENGIKATIKEIRNIIGKPTRKRAKMAP